LGGETFGNVAFVGFRGGPVADRFEACDLAWSSPGLALVAAGAGLVVYSFLAPANRVIGACPGGCPGGFVSFGEGDGTSSGVLIAPLGYSIALSGGFWALSSYFVPHTRATPWLELGLGLLLGAGAYALSAAAGG
jgi:hypothetical protein